MNILFVTLPYYGHLVPTLGLLEELVRMGYPLPFGWGILRYYREYSQT